MINKLCQSLAAILALSATLFACVEEPTPQPEAVAESEPAPKPEPAIEGLVAAVSQPSVVTVERTGDSSYRYLVNGTPQLFIGMGYNPIYRDLEYEERATMYDRDFRMLCEAGVNHIVGWDADKGYEQDKFDELTLDYAYKYGIGVVMPFYLPADGDYRDASFRETLLNEAREKIERFKNHPAIRMWGVGNEVLLDMTNRRMRIPFGRFYLQLADLFHALDPNHPVIYRESGDYFIPAIRSVLKDPSSPRPWLLYGMNIYDSDELERILDVWPSAGLNRAIIVSEFGAEPTDDFDRAEGYAFMWRTIRDHPDYVLGGAPYAWTTAGPEPTDIIWGLMDRYSDPVDDTLRLLAEEWRRESLSNGQCQSKPLTTPTVEGDTTGVEDLLATQKDTAS